MSEEKLTYNAKMFKETFQNDFTYLNGFLRNVHRFGERTALICPIRDLSWTYPQVNTECNRLAHALMEDGVKKQDLVMYQLLNSAEFFFYIWPRKKLVPLTARSTSDFPMVKPLTLSMTASRKCIFTTAN